MNVLSAQEVKQQGLVMPIALVFLFIMAILSLSTWGLVVVQERSAAQSNQLKQAERVTLNAITDVIELLDARDDVIMSVVEEAIEDQNPQSFQNYEYTNSIQPSFKATIEIRLIDITQSNTSSNQYEAHIEIIATGIVTTGIVTDDTTLYEARRGYRI